MGNVTEYRPKWPWEIDAPSAPLEDTVAKMQRDMAYMVQYTSVLVHSPHEALQILVNTPRGQIVPRGECKFTDGTALEFQDLGMPQPGAPRMSVEELMQRVWTIANELGLEIKP